MIGDYKGKEFVCGTARFVESVYSCHLGEIVANNRHNGLVYLETITKSFESVKKDLAEIAKAKKLVALLNS
jgi:hypothetical protein